MEEMNNLLDLDLLRSFGTMPRLSEQGCIELPLDEHQVLCFYHPDLDGFGNNLHDHHHDLVITVLAGTITHELVAFEPQEDGGQAKTQVDHGADHAPVHGAVRALANVTTVAGSRLFLTHDLFRRVLATRCIVHEERGRNGKAVAHRIRPRGTDGGGTPLDADRCWAIIADLLGRNAKPGYHLRPIAKGVLGEASKIVEEAEEFAEAIEQGVALMALLELADLQGAVEAYLANHHPSLRLDDLKAMSAVTKRAFANGRRQ